MKEWMAMYIDYCRDYSEQAKSAKSVAKLFKDLSFVSEKRRDGVWYCIGRKGVDDIGASASVSVENYDDEQLPF